MNVDSRLEAASTATGLDDFGDSSFREGLDVLTRSLDREAGLHEHGRAAVENLLSGLLVTRLKIEACYREHPEIDDQGVPRPVIQLGLPRTGSTALGNLLAQDRGIRYLRSWESMNPVPPPDATVPDDPRIAEAEAALGRRRDLAPRLRTMVPGSAQGPGECLGLLRYHFQSVAFCGSFKIPSYADWLFAADMEPAYRYHRRLLKLLQWKTPPNRWRLRTPAHMLAIDALDAVYPDAEFVMTHRDVASVIPSVADLHTTLAAMHTDQPDAEFFGDFCVRQWDLALRRTIAFRDAGREGRFHDVAFQDVQEDPVGSVHRLYESLGETLSTDTEERMQRWWTEHPPDRHGSHQYTPEAFGLTAKRLRAKFRFYAERFEVPLDL